MKILIIIISVSILLSACTANKQLTKLDIDLYNATVAGRVKIYYNGKDVTSETTILFNEYMLGIYNYNPDSTGYLITKLPIGRCHICYLSYSSFSFLLLSEETQIFLEDPNKIYYIGDLTLNWIGPIHDNSALIAASIGGAVGGFINTHINKGKLTIFSEDKSVEFGQYFNNRFNLEKEIINCTLNFPEPDSTFFQNLAVQPSENPDYNCFNLTKDRSCYGKVRMINNKKIYVEQERKLFIFRKKELISVTDFEGNDITEETLNQKGFRKINYNSYETITL